MLARHINFACAVQERVPQEVHGQVHQVVEGSAGEGWTSLYNSVFNSSINKCFFMFLAFFVCLLYCISISDIVSLNNVDVKCYTEI